MLNSNNKSSLRLMWDFLTLKTYHENLLTNGGSTYLTVISIIMILAAISEGFAWGFLGSTFTPEQPMIGWLIVGGFVFLLMWFFDRSMASSDLLKNEHEKTLNGLDIKTDGTPFLIKIKSGFFKFFPFLIRICIVCLSLYVTAPFLTQLVFKADIDNKMMEQYRNNIILAKNSGVENLDKKINQLETSINQTNEKLQKEIGGKSGTGYGYGSVAKSIERQLSTLESDLKMTRSDREVFVQKFDQAVDKGDQEELKKYGITITKDSPIFRQNAIEEFEKQPAFHQVKFAVDIFLLILGTILISAKLMQPRTLQMYFSSRLQEKWKLYQSGFFDAHLLEQEQSKVLKDTMISIPEEFEQIIISSSKEQKQRKEAEMIMLKEREKVEIEKKKQKIEDDNRKLLKEREKQEQEEERELELERAEKAHLERLATEKAEIELREKSRTFYEGQILKALNEVEEAESEYLSKFKHKIEEVETVEETLVTELHNVERIHKNHIDNVEARVKRIEVARADLKDMQELVNSLQNMQDSPKLEHVRAFTNAANAVVSQKDYIKNMETSLLTFETDQKYHQENLDRIRTQLTQTQKNLTDLKTPLNIISSARSQVEAYKMKLLGEQGLLNIPYEKHDEKEIPLLISKLKKQLSTQVPTYL